MLNYILADYKRITLRVPRLVIFGIFELLFIYNIVSNFILSEGSYTSVDLVNKFNTFVFSFGAFYFGTVDFITSFSQDFKSKTIQVAIGLGISRFKVIISKLIQTALVVLTDIIVTFLIALILSLVLGLGILPQQIGHMLLDGWYTLVMSVCAVSFSMAIMFRFQNSIFSMILYWFLSFGAVSSLLRLLSRQGPEIFSRLHLENYTFESCAELFRSHLLMGRFHFLAFIGIFVFIGIGVAITYALFNKYELDF